MTAEQIIAGRLCPPWHQEGWASMLTSGAGSLVRAMSQRKPCAGHVADAQLAVNALAGAGMVIVPAETLARLWAVVDLAQNGVGLGWPALRDLLGDLTDADRVTRPDPS